MNIVWDEQKDVRLKAKRGISFVEIELLILQKKYIDIMKHPRRPGQWMFILPVRGYIYVVPFVVDEDGNIVLKTAFPSRKFNKRFEGKRHENEA